jgi:hypothetical protein
MGFGINLTENFLDPSFGVNQKGRPLITPILAAIICFFDPHAVFLRNLVVFVGQQNEGKVFLLFKFGLTFDRVRADSNDHGAGGFILGEIITDSLGLDRSTTGHRFRKEIKHDPFAFEIRQFGRFTRVIEQFKIRGNIIFTEHISSPYF